MNSALLPCGRTALGRVASFALVLSIATAPLGQTAPRAEARATPADQRRRLAEAVDAAGAAALGPRVSAVYVAVDIGGDHVLSRGFGAGPAGRAPDADTPFHAGALLSTFLSVAALQLAEEGRLDLESSLAEHFPELPYGELGVRVDHLLTQTSGIPGYGELLRSTRRSAEDERSRILAWLRNGPLEAAPGACASYSNSNDLLLGLVIEKASGRSVPERLTEAVFAPAGMDDTTFADDPGVRGAPVEQEFAGSFEDQAGAPAPFGAGGLTTTAHDLLRFQRALVELRLLPASALERRATPATLADGSTADHGRGISLAWMDDAVLHSAGGGSGGQRMRLVHVPAADATIVVWSSGSDAPVQPLSARVARVLLALDAPEVLDLPTTAELRARRVGEYYAGCTSHAIVEEHQYLVLQPPDGPRRRLLYQGGDSFVASDDPEVRLQFESEAGEVVAFVLVEHGVSVRARRLF